MAVASVLVDETLDILQVAPIFACSVSPEDKKGGYEKGTPKKASSYLLKITKGGDLTICNCH